MCVLTIMWCTRLDSITRSRLEPDNEHAYKRDRHTVRAVIFEGFTFSRFSRDISNPSRATSCVFYYAHAQTEIEL